jgi:hypothetical protein
MKKKKNEKLPTEKKVKDDLLIDKLKAEKNELLKKYKYALRKISQKEAEISVLTELKKKPKIEKIKPASKRIAEATPVIVLSDWHVEETVFPQTVNFLNEYSDAIALERTEWLFKNSLRLLDINKRDVKIDNVVLALLGDFISNSIHEELREVNSMRPSHAIIFVQKILISGIQFLLDNTDFRFTIVCCSGNHGRLTQKLHISTEVGNSLEYLMYKTMAQNFEREKRVNFVISEGYHSYLNVYDKTLRFHHGHAIKYHGGIGGIYIPVNKAIAQWNKAKHADLDVFGHFHQFRDGGNFISNGSVIGYSPFAISIKADPEKPRQAFFLVDSRRGKTVVAPVLLHG